MFIDNPRFFPVDHKFILFAGELNEDQLQEYLDEPGGRLDHEPHSDFSKDLGRFYDHDYLYAEGSQEKKTIRELAILNGIEEEALIEKLERSCGKEKEFNCFIILWNAELIEGELHDLANGKLKIKGCWEHESPLTD
ncbi:hypothetical protein [Cerasicoccus frondis]|uniref:hypothetical protein n=1 Tax=Cerasicoccus frondis TaxID=490090 RepID=UPI0028527E16|nr:hypothetical protein [Cerasicoccus frondis]